MLLTEPNIFNSKLDVTGKFTFLITTCLFTQVKSQLLSLLFEKLQIYNWHIFNAVRIYVNFI